MAKKGRRKKRITRKRINYSASRRLSFTDEKRLTKAMSHPSTKKVKKAVIREIQAVKQYENKNRRVNNAKIKRRVHSELKSLHAEKIAGVRQLDVCRNRKTRKEVLHANKKTGKGTGNKRPKWTIKSYIKC